jgi:hypothetical protein
MEIGRGQLYRRDRSDAAGGGGCRQPAALGRIERALSAGYGAPCGSAFR